MSTFWNGEPTPARRVTVRIPLEPMDMPPQAWYRGLEGTVRKAVEVTYRGQVFFLDDDAHEGDETDVGALLAMSRDDLVALGVVQKALGTKATVPQRHYVSAPGSGWAKVTEGHGSPNWGHRGLPADCEVIEP